MLTLSTFATKRCTGPCGRSLPLSAFYKRSDSKDGLTWQCKECRNAVVRKRYTENREKINAWVTKQRAKNREKINAQQRKCNAENREKINAQQKKHRAENKNEINAQARKHRAENRERYSIQARKHRAENREKINARKRARHRTPKGYTTNLWNHLNSRCSNGSHQRWKNKRCRSYLNKGIELRMTRDELYQFVLSNWDLILAIWATGEQVNIHRINSSGHYELGNIMFLSKSDHDALHRKQRLLAHLAH